MFRNNKGLIKNPQWNVYHNNDNLRNEKVKQAENNSNSADKYVTFNGKTINLDDLKNIGI